MQHAHNQWLALMLQQYKPYFDITTYDDDAPLKNQCVFHSRSEKYVLSKKAQLWAAETNEYLYIFSVPTLNLDTYTVCRDRALALGMELVKPHSEHMYSYITAIILYDEAEEEALQALQQYKKSQNFKLSLHGWMEYRIAAVNVHTHAISANKSGKDVKQFLQNISRAIKNQS